MGFGTLLGTVRHSGFIPWDDDIDVVMLREDYERMINMFPTILPDNLFLQTNTTDKEYPRNFGKLRMNDTVFKSETFQELNMLMEYVLIFSL